MQTTPVIDQSDIQTALTFADELEKRGCRMPVYMIILALWSSVFLIYGLREAYLYRESIQPGPNILERLDAVPDDENVPVILRVSGESRKGLVLVQLESQVRAMDAAMVSIGFTFIVIGAFGISFVYAHRRDGTRDILLAKLLRSYVADMDETTEPTPP